MFSVLEKFIFLALVFSIPFQKRSFLFGPDEFFEWNSEFFYFTDALLAALFVFWLINRSYGTYRSYKTYAMPLGLFLLFAFISVFQAELVDVAAYRFIKLAELLFLFFYVAERARGIGVKKIMASLVASGAFQSIIAIAQFAKQSSLGLHIFHESTLEIGMKGVAEIVSGGVYMIRAYGTFPNPNVLAGFLGICLFFAFYLFLTTPNPSLVKRGFTTLKRGETGGVVKSISIFLLSFALILTFSRGVIIFFLLTSALFFAGLFLLRRFREYKKSAARLLLLFVICCLLIVALAWPEISSRFLESSVSEPAVAERLFFNKVGIETATQDYSKLFLGVGIGNFVNYYMGSIPNLAPHLYQPVHNIFILIASEIGIFGLFALVLFLASLIGAAVKKLSGSDPDSLGVYSLLVVVCFMLLVSMYDHYFWTLQQGSLMFWIVLGLLAGSLLNPLVNASSKKV